MNKIAPNVGFTADETILTNAKLVLPDAVIDGSIVIKGGLISAIDTGSSRLPQAYDCEGDYVIPGLVDVHTDNLEKHLEPRPGVRWPSLAALQVHDAMMAAAGVTTVFDSLVIGELDHGKAGRRDALVLALEALELGLKERIFRSEHLLHVRCELPSTALAGQLERFLADPFVQLVSLMDHTPGQRQWWNLESWKKYRGLDGLSDDHPDIQSELRRLQDLQKEYSEKNRQLVIERCQEKNIPLASHDDATVAHVEEGHSQGILISEFPTSQAAARRAHELGMRTIMGSPNVVKGGSHSGNVGAGHLAELGLLDGLASDYVPMSMIHGAFILYENHGILLPDAVNTVTRNPASMVGLSDRGELKEGLRADIVRVRHYQHVPLVRRVWCAGIVAA